MKKLFLLAVLISGPVFAGGPSLFHVAVFGGATTFHDDTTAKTAGFDIEMALPLPFLGIGAFGDFAFKDPNQVNIYGGFLALHPIGGLKILAGAALENTAGHNAFLARLGLGYDFHTGPISYGPFVAADRVDSHMAYVYGIALGVGI